MTVREMPIAVSGERLDDLRRRLRNARTASNIGAGEDWRYGVPADYLRDLVTTWTTSFDWREQEARINRYEHMFADIDGVRIHALVHRAGRAAGSAPAVLLTHGWPWTFWDYEAVIDPLTQPERHGGDAGDAFDVVVPSLPGYGFSTPLHRQGVNPSVTADLWVALMRELGYERFFAHGADWGQRVTIELGRRHPESVLGIHLVNAPLAGLASARPWADAFAPIYERSSAPEAQLAAWERTRASHVVVHGLDPQTLAHAMHDSPAGLCAWLVQRRHAWSDCDGDVESVFSRDQLLTAATIYWVTDSFASSARMYWEAMNGAPPTNRASAITVPTAISIFTRDIPPGYDWDDLHEQFSDLRTIARYDRGGHFAPVERPDVIIAVLRGMMREVMASGVTG